jgi:hypothetical protein
VSARRDENLRIKWPEIPAETTYSAAYRKRAVCEDWMVETVGLELGTHHPVIEPVSASRPGTGISDAETGDENGDLITRRDQIRDA